MIFDLDDPPSSFTAWETIQWPEWEEVCNLNKECPGDLSCVNFFSEYQKNGSEIELYKTGYMCADPDGVCGSPYITSFKNEDESSDKAAPSYWHFRCDLQEMNLG